VVVLQSCTDSLQVLPSSSGETFPASSDSTYDVGNTGVEEDGEIIEECFLSINKEVAIGFKQEEIPGDITFPDIKAEPDKVSYICVYALSDTFYQCSHLLLIETTPLMGLKMLCFYFLGGGWVLCRW
jgi:hypothetical protein